jgi:hypothetical protein
MRDSNVVEKGCEFEGLIFLKGPGNPRMMVVAWGKAVADVKPPRDGTKPVRHYGVNAQHSFS